ncbi:MAG: hypothetical protein FWE88_06370 [Phycisphaerae bacterium]|nr:hypothetical protein [Phycisphaerae bacterium]
MSMTSREIFKAVLEFNNPPRIGMTLPAPYPSDLHWVSRKPARVEDVELTPVGGEIRRWKDNWGNTWATLTTFDKGEVVEGAVTDWSQLDAYTPPSLGRAQEYAHIPAERAAHTDKFIIGGVPGFVFNCARYIRKLENYLCDLVVERENVDRLNAIVARELLAMIDRYGAAGCDGIMFPEDWGTQDRVMISPEMFREIFKPYFVTLCGRAHEHGMKVLMHSCGKITEIIDDLIDAGVDLLQFDQPTLHGIETLGRRFGGRVTFWCPVDIQRTLQTKDATLIRAEAKQLVDTLGRFGGGFVAGCYPSNEAIGLTAEPQDIACKAFVEYGTFR